jgi:hypothetical protein
VSAQSVAIDDHGDVAAAYEAIGDGPIMTNTRRDEVVTSDAGGAFSPPQSLGASGRSFADHVVIAPNGTATETLTDSNGLEASSRPLGGTFGAPHVISAVAEGDALANPANLSGSSGEMLDGLLLDDAAFDGQNLHVAAALAPAGGPFGAPVTVEQLPAGSTFSAIDGSIDASGDAAALSWNESPSTDSAGVIRVAVAGDGQSTGPGGGQPGGGHPGNGTPPNTKLTGKEIDRKHHRATFTFKAIGSATGFRCALITKTRHTHPKPRFSACRSPKSYKHLKHGHYTFEVAAVGSAGADRTPAIARFTT